MVPYFLLENIDAVEMLANMHSDDHLLQLVESFENENRNSDASYPKMDEASNLIPAFEENENEQYREFDFYH
ncbi:hypothetical protein TNCT_585641 [Trichonephila clavata]|uniref:Uncharacterized protein n=1 Tax=Trichonephila clavata TaxID=2740835 RepID=A0A8X6L9C0_TRICU|nr:hypothetical protein TNCT_585641 [Trichonephila clavata]